MHGSLWRQEHLVDGDIFSWSGDNDHDERLKAGRKLCDHIVTVTSRDPKARVHFIAHSHGGNVLLKAVELYHRHLLSQGARIFTHLQEALDRGDSAETAAEDAIRREFPELTETLPQPWVDNLAEFCRGNLVKRSSAKRLFRLMQPEYTGMLLFQKDWASWSQANRLGRIVFLGTPFFRKQWSVSRHAIVRFILWVLKMVPTLPFHALLPYIGILFWGWILAFTPWVASPSWNPLEWPNWLMLSWLGMSIIALTGDWRQGRKRNTNMYFDSHNFQQYLLELRAAPLALSQERKRNKIDSLVVNAQYLDEALIGLSCEPLIYAALLPRVRSLLYARPAPIMSGYSEDIGSGGGFSSLYWVPIKFTGRVLANLLYGILLPFWSPMRHFVLEPVLREALVRVICSATFGLPPDQLRGARIQVRNSLDLPEVFDETFWDITSDVLRNGFGDQPDKESPRSGLDPHRYSHITDSNELKRKLQCRLRPTNEDKTTKKNWLQQLWIALPTLYRRYESGFILEDSPSVAGYSAKLGLEEFGDSLARIGFTAEERIKETIGTVELTHSLYYSNDDVIRAIARFLETGESPPGATHKGN